MKTLLVLLVLGSAALLRDDNSLHDLVFDFSSDLKSTLPADGWVKIDFSVMHFREQPMHIRFKAVCIESGMELTIHPQKNFFTLKHGEEQRITLFMNVQTGKLENIAPGQHSRTIRFVFADTEKKDTLVFEQMYVIHAQPDTAGNE